MADKNHRNKIITRDVINETSKKFNSNSAVTAQHGVTDEEMTESDYSIELLSCENISILGYINNILHVPLYLSSEINNKFEEMIQQNINPLADSIYIEELRCIAILICRIHTLDLETSLWNHYLKSGTGLLKSNESNLKVWPEVVQTMITQLLSSSRTKNNDLNQTQVNDKYYMRFVREHLRKFNSKQQKIKQELIKMKKEFDGYENTIDDVLQTFVQTHMKCLRLGYEYEMKMIEFNYYERIIDHEFQQQNPTSQQITSTKDLFDQKHRHEQTKQEVLWIQQNINHNNLPTILRSVDLSFPSSIQSLINMDLNSHLSHDQHQITPQHKQKMMQILLDTLERKLHKSQLLHNDQIAKLWQNQSIFQTAQPLTQTMIEIIQRHLLAIKEKTQREYNFRRSMMNCL